MQYRYVQYEAAPVETSLASQKPNNVSMADFSKALDNNRHDLKMIARFEVDRANRKVDRAANMMLHESKKMR